MRFSQAVIITEAPINTIKGLTILILSLFDPTVRASRPADYEIRQKGESACEASADRRPHPYCDRRSNGRQAGPWLKITTEVASISLASQRSALSNDP